jgi:hypothetical protein
MAKYLRVGVHRPNRSGYTSKAWSIRRHKSVVVVGWGSVEVRGAGHGSRIYWASGPQQKTIRCGSEKRALAYVQNAMAKRVSHEYERLPGKVRIRKRLKRRQR